MQGCSIVIKCADNGKCYSITYDDDAISFGAFKEKIRAAMDIPIAEQIILLGGRGHPFKGLSEKHYSPAVIQEQEIFVFSQKNILRMPPPNIIEPEKQEIYSVEHYFSPNSNGYRIRSNILQDSRNFVAEAEQNFQQQTVLVEALAAAYSNIKEQFRIDSKTFKADESYLSEQLGKYQFLLQEFDDKIEALKHVPLHPALTKHFFQNQPTIISSDIPMPESGSAMDSIKNNPSGTENNNIGMDEANIQQSGASNSSPSMLDPNSSAEHTGASHPSGRTLQDVLPVEEERQWKEQCSAAHANVRLLALRLH